MRSNELDGKRVQRRKRVVPSTPHPSIFTKPHKGQPLNFYNPKWFNELLRQQRMDIANTHEVAFLPDASQLLMGVTVPFEKLSDRNLYRKFTHQFFDTLTKPYDLTHEIENHDEDDKQTNGNDNDNDNSSFKGEEIDLANLSSEEEEEPKEDKEDRAFVDDLMDTTNTHPGEHQGKDNEEELAREVCYNAMLLDEDKDLGPAVEINKSFNIQAFLKHALKAKK
ncbi:hypothetical protein PTTG_26992 [Puccinia triticina 1-1 BBBD Race 1]|uniref:Uncharacterized protein n=1 Tax=Puccinia triticina (isolate 1-1 / race 1 (BBBD)) TaxID=630390 RepID=A0A180GQU5_PUCT1|nr:hypothetical protein PTTG_26992 [Puccinia triticina 1-1 BBBD Race 1]